ncbi:hypothetical protein ACKF11_08755 [Methylobacillus sp. Pita2]|uniref:hypothetical protein n=1 Tax=Methylobacillus sp. Pita2 TaxID=3383245 RepID=UPI0038B4D92E
MARNTLTIPDNKTTAFIDDARGEIALKATWEIEALTKELIERSKTIGEDHVDLWHESLFIKGVSMRIKELNSIVIGAIGDGSESPSRLQQRLG